MNIPESMIHGEGPGLNLTHPTTAAVSTPQSSIQRLTVPPAIRRCRKYLKKQSPCISLNKHYTGVRIICDEDFEKR